MSKLLRQALKYSILPASVMIVGKLFGLYLAIQLYDFPIYLEHNTTGLFTAQLYFTDLQETLIANSFSNLFMLSLLVSINTYFLGRHLLLKSALNNPKTIVKLTKINILKWATNGEVPFLKVFIWNSFLWATSAIIITSSLNNETYSWIGITSFIVVILFAWGLIRVFEEEIQKVFPINAKHF